jgi:hypothetical protein
MMKAFRKIIVTDNVNKIPCSSLVRSRVNAQQHETLRAPGPNSWTKRIVVLIHISLALLPNICSASLANPLQSKFENDADKTEPPEQENKAFIEYETRSDAKDRSSNSDDNVEDSMYDPLQIDPECGYEDCWSPPESTMEQITTAGVDATCSYGGVDPDGLFQAEDEETRERCTTQQEMIVDKHWGSDPHIIQMRDKLRQSGSGISSKHERLKKINDTATGSTTPTNHATAKANESDTVNKRPPIFLMPGLASTRLVAWRFKSCPHHPLLSDIKVQDYVWLNINLVMQMGTIDVSCMKECLQLGWNQTDTDDIEIGCKLRPDEGLDAISSLSPGGISTKLLVGGTNTVYAWLVQWLADNLGYDVSNIVGLPYDWRLSPDKMQSRDGFLTLTRRRIEAAVQSNGKPGIMVAHSMGNLIFRYFLEWLKTELQQEAFHRYVKQADRRAKMKQKAARNLEDEASTDTSYLSGWVTGFDEWWSGSPADETDIASRNAKLWELAQMEGETAWYEWIETHIWTYIGLSSPMLGAINPLRAVISGENMGVPMEDSTAREMEITFGSTHTVNPLSTKEGFCDRWDFDDWGDEELATTSARTAQMNKHQAHVDSRLACLDDIVTEIEGLAEDQGNMDPWKNYPALKALLLDREDWDSDQPMVQITTEYCDEKEKSPCAINSTFNIGPLDVQSGEIFTKINKVWREELDPLKVKKEQLEESFWNTAVPNMLNSSWERPLIKHVIMAYGVDVPTEVGYTYRKRVIKDTSLIEGEYDGIPNLQRALWEDAGGTLYEERFDVQRGGFGEMLGKKRPRRTKIADGSLHHSGDGSVPYLSLMWAHTWLLHAVRALRHDGSEGPKNPLDGIEISHRPKGAMEWMKGSPPKSVTILGGDKKYEESSDTGTAHPHGTKYKPEMIRYHSAGTSRTTGIEYTTTVLEALRVEHKETTRNYDILAAVFTDVLRKMHDDLNIV